MKLLKMSTIWRKIILWLKKPALFRRSLNLLHPFLKISTPDTYKSKRNDSTDYWVVYNVTYDSITRLHLFEISIFYTEVKHIFFFLHCTDIYYLFPLKSSIVTCNFTNSIRMTLDKNLHESIFSLDRQFTIVLEV